MKTLHKILMLIAIVLPLSVFGQDVTYTFDAGGNGENISGTYTNLVPYGATVAANFSTGLLTTNYGLAANLGNATNVFNGNGWTGTNMGGVDLTAFTATGDQQVDWTMYIKTATTASKGNGVVLRAQSTVSGYSTGVRQGYHFTCYGSGTSGSVKFRVGRLDGTASYINIQTEITVPITGFTQGPLYLRAKAVGSLLYFEYSTDRTNYANFPGSPYYDTTFPTATSTNGTVQIVWGLNGGTMDHYYDDVILSSKVVTLSGTKFSYTGSAQSPTINKSGFTSPTETKTFTGIGGTSYGPSSTAPSAPGTYILTASETESSVTKSATISFDILPSTFDQVYTFNSDAIGSTAANTTCVTSGVGYNHLVQRFGNNVMIGSTLYPTNSNMLSPNGSNEKALTTLNNFGSSTTDYSVTWKMYFTNIVGNKHLVFLRANNISLNGTNLLGGTGYEFYIQMQTGTSTVNASIYKLASGGAYTSGTLLGSNTSTLAQSQNYQNRAMWFRASTIGSSSVAVKLEYSTDGTTWYTLCSGTDASSPYASGSTQITGINNNNTNYFFDYFGYTDLTKNVTLSGSKFISDGTSKSPTIAKTGFTSPTETKSYTGISGTSYSTTTAAPSATGTYYMTVSEVENGVTRTASQVFYILPATYDKMYTFDSDNSGSAAANTTQSTGNGVLAGHIIQQFSAATESGYSISEKTLYPNSARAITSLDQFGTVSTDYSVTWKEYNTSASANKHIIVLRAAPTTSNSYYDATSGNFYPQGQGYGFLINPTGTSAITLQIYKLNTSSTWGNIASTSFSSFSVQGVPLWFRATATGSSTVILKFEYSTNGTTWNTALSTTDVSNTVTSGATHIFGVNNNNQNYNFDYFGLIDLTKNVTANDNKFIYTGSALSPTVSYPGFTSPTKTLTYIGTGGTSYTASATAPTAVGTYSLAVTASESGVSRTGLFGFEIVPSSYDNLYTFKTDVVGSTPANIVYPTSASANGTGVVSIYPGTDNGAGATAITFQPTAVGSVAATGVANVTAFASSSNYSVTWKEYIGAYGFKKGFLLQGQSATSAYTNDLKQGYLFIVLNDATNGTILKIYKVDASGVGYPVTNPNNTIANPVLGNARWYRATVSSGSQKFEYSDNGTTWTTGLTWTDATYSGLSGTTQLVYGLGAGVGGYYYDYIASSAIGSSLSGGGNWSSASWTKTPTVSSDVVLSSGEVVIDANTTVNSITLNPGTKLTLNSGTTLNLSTINIKSDVSGTATFVNNGTTTITSANVQQYLPQGRNWYVGSPVSLPSAATLKSVQLDSAVVYYNEPTSSWTTDYTGTLTSGKGYVAIPFKGTSGTNTATFSGTLNNGNVSVGLTRQGTTKAGFNLVANPYPSYLNAMTAINVNSNMEQTIWYRTRSTETTPTYYFETVNTASGVGTNNAGSGKVTGYVPPMQAFWVRTNTDNNSITFTNAMRFHAGNVSTDAGTTPTTILKSPAAKNVIQQVLRLQVSNGVKSDEAVIYTNSNAQNAFDAYDSQKMTNGNKTIPEICTIVGDEHLVINGLNNIQSNMNIPIGFTTGQSNTFTIKAAELSNFDSDTKVYLKDNLLNKEQELTTDSSYCFKSDTVTASTRFSIIFKSTNTTTGLSSSASYLADLIYKNANNQITVNCQGSISNDAVVSVYNSVGQKLLTDQITCSETVINTVFTPGVYVVSVCNSGKVTTQRVIL